jgi:hypothetical protein|tara:strand:+ start:1159 stop:1443 length:285 start_codon:yes stop_codon:yes gene_type:complete
MKIEFNKTEPFVSWGNAIGIVLYSRENDTHVNFFTGDMTHSRVNREELGSPSLVELKLELENNDSLRYLAEENKLITVTLQHTIDFLEYATSYN